MLNTLQKPLQYILLNCTREQPVACSTANETFLDVKKILARWLWEMLTKKRLPERFEILLLLLALFTAYFRTTCLFVVLCEYNFIVLENLHRRLGERDGERQPGKNLYLLYVILQSKLERGPEIFFVNFSSPFSCHFKSHSRCWSALEERYIVTAASDIYFCKHPHNVVALLYATRSPFRNAFQRLNFIFFVFAPWNVTTKKRRKITREITFYGISYDFY